jgi:hypothetical protein
MDEIRLSGSMKFACRDDGGRAGEKRAALGFAASAFAPQGTARPA